MTYSKRNPNGRASAANSGPIVLSTEDKSALDLAAQPTSGQAASAASKPVTLATDTFPASSYAPYQEPATLTGMLPGVDPAGNQTGRVQALTDEGGYRANYANASLAVNLGTCTFTNGSNRVTTAVDLSTVDVHVGDYVFLTADGNQFALQVDDAYTNLIVLEGPYQGTGGTGASSRQYQNIKIGTGTSHSVSSGSVTLTSGTSTNAVIELERDIDYLPITKLGQFSVSQRIANQNIYYGFYDENGGGAARWYYWFNFNGTDATKVDCVCAWNPTTAPSGGEIVSTTVTLPAGATTSASSLYRIEVLADRVIFYINGVVVRTEQSVVPHPTDFLISRLAIVNGTGASSTNVVVNFDACKNYNVLSMENPSNQMSITNPNVPMVDDVNYNVAGVITINTDLAFIDCSAYRAISVQCVSMGTTGVVTPAFSNDGGTTWFGGTLYPSVTTGTAQASTFNAAGLWVIPVMGKLMRLRLTTATTAGTTTLRCSGMNQIPFVVPGSMTVTAAANWSSNVAQVGGTNVVTGGVAGIQAVGGNIAHSTATTANPVPTGGRVVPTTVATVDVSLAAGDTSWNPISTGYQVITKDFGTSELDWASVSSFTPTVWASAATLTQVRPASGTASVRTYVTAMEVQTDALGAATSLWLLDGPVAVTSVTIATPGVFTNSGTNNFKVGDPVVFENLGTITGISANTVYYVTATTLAATTFTVAATSGGTALQITGSTATPTVYRVLKQVRLQTASLPLTYIQFLSPIKTDPNVQLSAITSGTTTGTVYLNCQGYYGF